ncbi:MAG TPA: TIGR04283 family arsenosugar biosynthesis glycosyltransferase [Mucilaginibacter sp.]
MNCDFKISIIIPARNESRDLPELLEFLCSAPGQEHIAEIIISDGRSSDNTVDIAKTFGAIVVLNELVGRARQMNNGAIKATGDVLYFLHADSIPPASFLQQIVQKISEGYDGGCFRLRFDHKHWFLRANAWFTRFNVNAVRFGDQSLFVKKNLFQKIGCFREDLIIMEDQEIIYRIRRKGKFGVMGDYITTSARKYRANGVYRMQGIFFYIYFFYQLGQSQEKLIAKYKKHIKPG